MSFNVASMTLALFFTTLVTCHNILLKPSPEEVKIAFVSYRTGTAEIFMMDAEGGQLEQITNSPENNRFPIQLDRRTLGFTRIDSLRKAEKYQIDIYTKEEKKQEYHPIVAGADWEQISPDKRYCAFLKNIEGVNELFLYDKVEKKEQQITHNLKEGIPAHSVNHVWSADSKHLAFMSGPDWYNQFIKVYNIEDNRLKVVSERGYMNSGLLWLQDNETLIANLKIRDETLYELYRLDVATQKLTPLTTGINLHPNLSPDGKWVVFESQRHGNDGEVYIMHPNGKHQIRLTNHPGYNGRCIWFEL